MSKKNDELKKPPLHVYFMFMVKMHVQMAQDRCVEPAARKLVLRILTDILERSDLDAVTRKYALKQMPELEALAQPDPIVAGMIRALRHNLSEK